MFRKNVVAVIFNEKAEFLACHRIDKKGWQFVQGGIEETDTDLILAARREIFEEIGLHETALVHVAEIPPPQGDPTKLRYLSPKFVDKMFLDSGHIGQEQRLLLFYMHSSTINTCRLIPPPESGAKQEFCSVAWMGIADLITRVPECKKHIFEHIRAVGSQMVERFLSTQTSNSF